MEADRAREHHPGISFCGAAALLLGCLIASIVRGSHSINIASRHLGIFQFLYAGAKRAIAEGNRPRTSVIEVFDFDPQSNLSSIWDPHVPPSVTNSLWYSSHCETTRSSQPGEYDTCKNTCIEALGVNTTFDQYNVSAKAPSDSNWTILFQPSGVVVTRSDDTAFGYNDSYNNLNVE
ncbi:hypothetical protein SCUP234_04699 [Seiridium cupressi]